MTAKKSYKAILQSSYTTGGAAGITFLLGMLRTKIAALLIGTVGVGLLASFTAIQSLIGSLAGIGLQSSAVREIAAAVSRGDEQAIGRLVQTLQRLCWLTGLVAMATMMALSPQISRLTFNSETYALDVAGLGIVILLANLAGGQLAVLQGMRRIGDMARASVSGAILGTISAIICYYFLGLRGIVPSFICIAAMQLAFLGFFAKRISIPSVTLTWGQTLREANAMVKLGVVFMWNGLMLSAVSYYTVTLISWDIDLNAAGLYSAAISLSGMAVNLVLGAMGTDYYPRLTGVAHDKATLNRLVNEQTEIGLLLALPGLAATLVLAPWILQMFYSIEFLASTELLQWFVMGAVFRVISWPLGYVILALGKGQWYLVTETTTNIFHVLLITVGLKVFGLEGVAIAFFILNAIYIVVVYLVCHRLTGFDWSSDCRLIFLNSLPVIAAIFIFCRYFQSWLSVLAAMSSVVMIGVVCLKALARRIGFEHKNAKVIEVISGFKSIIALFINRK